MAEEKEKFLVRDVFNESVVKKIAAAIKREYPEFKQRHFTEEIVSQFPKLSFSERSGLITDKLYEYLPKDFPQSCKILVNILPDKIQGEALEGYDGFIVWPMSIYISRYGMQHFDLSINALYEMTKRFSAEGAIRYFLIEYPEQTLKVMEKWINDPNPHVRRLVSEGSRPRLPWTIRLHQFIKDPKPVLHLLEKLKEDPALFVRRSVANNMNDIAKDHPELAADVLSQWNKSKNPGTKWIVQHGSRTLQKMGNKKILAALGYVADEGLTIKKFRIENTEVKFGNAVSFSFEVHSEKKSAELMIDYIIHHKKSNGATTPKVFKLAKKKITSDEPLLIEKRHPIREITTRKYYPGEHLIEIQINGNSYGKKKFMLIM